jgi:hypothetical protein
MNAAKATPAAPGPQALQDPKVRRARRRRADPLIERRFPLHLEPHMQTIRGLYHEAKAAHWDPEKHIPWAKFDAAAYTPEQRKASALSWSRRAWTEYGGLPETPAILIRFCLEHGGESDPKMFLTVRGSEEAWHTECCWRFADLAGKYSDRPASDDYAHLFNQDFHREAFEPGISVDAYIAVHSAILDGIDLELNRGYLRHATDPVVVAMLKRMVQDKERHVAFGWIYLTERAPGWSDAERAEISAEIDQALEGLLCSGAICAWLAPKGIAADVVAADELTRSAGLGAMSAAEESAVVTQFLGEASEHLARLGVGIADIRSRVAVPG